MRVLIVGSGAREHALTWKFSKSRRISGLYAAPGNAGTYELATNLEYVDPVNPESVLKSCRDNKINLVFIGPEAPLAAGLADELTKAGLAVIGPGAEAARLESSKAFAKEFMKTYRIPTAEYREFRSVSAFERYVRNVSTKIVVKKSGLAAGKGVLESADKDEILAFGTSVLKDDVLVVEEFLTGYEVSIFALVDGQSYLMLPPCADFKKAYDGDNGPNTGGMGSVCPVPWLNSAMLARIRIEVVEPTVEGLLREGLLYKGVLFFGLMITEEGPKLLEYNVRFGDPETQALLPTIDSDIGNICDAIISSAIDTFPLRINDYASLGVVVASGGYPGEYAKGKVVEPIPSFPEKEVMVFHSSTHRFEDGTVVTDGGRCFTVVGRGRDLLSANMQAYGAVDQVRFMGAWYRKDIGHKFFIE